MARTASMDATEGTVWTAGMGTTATPVLLVPLVLPVLLVQVHQDCQPVLKLLHLHLLHTIQ
jgi:hypothetical protein